MRGEGLGCVAVLSAAMLAAAPAAAWEPSKSVEFIIPAGTGGGADQMARFTQGVVAKHNLMRHSVVPINKSGGAGAEGFLDVKASRGDQHKIIITLSNLFTTPLATGVPFNWKDLTPVAMLALDNFVLWVPADTGYRSPRDYLDAVKKAGPNKYKMGGTGSKQEDQIITVAIEKASGVKFTYIPFKGGGAVATEHTDLVAGGVGVAEQVAGVGVEEGVGPGLGRLPDLIEEGACMRRLAEGEVQQLMTANDLSTSESTYLEVVKGKKTAPEAADAAATVYAALGMHPLKLGSEIPGFVADRLLEAVWRESLHMINEGVATTAEIDDAIRFGCGIRFSFMGSFLIYTLAGGDAGMRHFMAQFGPALELPWTKLKAPPLSDQLIDRVVEGTDQQKGNRSIKQLERYRDDAIISVMDAIKGAKQRHGLRPDE